MRRMGGIANELWRFEVGLRLARSLTEVTYKWLIHWRVQYHFEDIGSIISIILLLSTMFYTFYSFSWVKNGSTNIKLCWLRLIACFSTGVGSGALSTKTSSLPTLQHIKWNGRSELLRFSMVFSDKPVHI